MWLYIPNLPKDGPKREALPSALASGDLTLLSPSQCRAIAPSVTWRGKSVQPQALSRRWKQGGFIRLLSGLTLEPSEASLCADAWISSLRATRASPTALRGTGKAIKTNASSSIRCFADLTKAGLILCSAKTSPAMQTDSLPRSSRHWRQWAAALRLEYSARPKLGTVTGANDCSSWPTARANDSEKRGEVSDDPRNGLVGAAEHWRTPAVNDPGVSAEGLLDAEGQTWQSGQRAYVSETGRNAQTGLTQRAELWRTPNVGDHKQNGVGAEESQDAGHQVMLSDQVHNWSSPTVRIHKGGGTALTRADGKSRLDMLDWQAESWDPSQVETSLTSSSLDQATGGGEASSIDTPNSNQPSQKRKLNPIFVEALMRWPTGLSGFDTAATALTPWLEQWRSFISMLASTGAAMMPDRDKTIELRGMLDDLRGGERQGRLL